MLVLYKGIVVFHQCTTIDNHYDSLENVPIQNANIFILIQTVKSRIVPGTLEDFVNMAMNADTNMLEKLRVLIILLGFALKAEIVLLAILNMKSLHRMLWKM